MEKLEAEYGPRDNFWDEFNIDIFVGFVPWPNQLGRKVDVTELAERRLSATRATPWLTHTQLERGFRRPQYPGGRCPQGDRRVIIAHIWGIVEGTSPFLGIENCWLNLGEHPGPDDGLV